MKRQLLLNALLFCISTSVMAQTSKLTLDARMQAERHQATTRTKAPGTTVGTLSAIVKLDETCTDKTLDALRTMGVKLQGRPCRQPRAKGIYISNGKKVIIK